MRFATRMFLIAAVLGLAPALQSGPTDRIYSDDPVKTRIKEQITTRVHGALIFEAEMPGSGAAPGVESNRAWPRPPERSLLPRANALRRGDARAAAAAAVPQRIQTAYAEAQTIVAAAPVRVYTVTDPSDLPDDSLPDGIHRPPTLRAALQNANQSPGLDKIVFDPGISTIFVGGGGLFASQAVHIDGQVGTSGRVVIDGSGLDPGQPVLSINTGRSTIRNLELVNGVRSGLQLGGNGGEMNVVQSCLIHDNNGAGINMNFCSNIFIGGIDSAGQETNYIYGQTGSGGFGISMLAGPVNNFIVGNYIGTADGFTSATNSRSGMNLECRTTYVYNNLISGHEYDGIETDAIPNFAGSAHVFDLNYIEVTADGDSALPNNTINFGYGGMYLNGDGYDTLIRNTISGNLGNGITVGNDVRENYINDNYIGTNSSGLEPVGNWTGILDWGTRTVVFDNIIGGNGVGVELRRESDSAVVTGNILGTWSLNQVPFGNGTGIRIKGSRGTIGGLAEADRNLVSGNGTGISLQQRGCSSNVIIGNWVGLHEFGDDTIPNGGSGIHIWNGANGNRIERNVVAGNGYHGIDIIKAGTARPNNNEIVGNIIGLAPDSVTPFPNQGHGIRVSGGDHNDLGNILGEANIIAGNDSSGVQIVEGTANQIWGNYIGTNAAGAVGLGNGAHGVELVSSDTSLRVDSNEVGGQGIRGNIIVSNTGHGVLIQGSMPTENQVWGNHIGTLQDTSMARPNDVGIAIMGSRHNRIGFDSVGSGNFVGHNRGNGIHIEADSTIIRRNHVFSSGNGISPTVSPGHGIYIDGSDNYVGAADTTFRNLVFDNFRAGVRIDAGQGNTIRGNAIYDNGDLGIDLSPFGVTKNDPLDLDDGPNRLLNFPFMDSMYTEVPFVGTVVFGGYYGRPNEIFTLDFYVNDGCDSLRYGEGLLWFDSLQVTTDGSGMAEWSVATGGGVINVDTPLTVTVTDTAGNTSEFSACWPYKIIEIVDIHDSIVPYEYFVLSRVDHDPPQLTETVIDSFFTDTSGLIYLSAEHVDVGDSLKISRLVETRPAVKHAADLGTALTIHLDNATFDSLTYAMTYDEIDTTSQQRIRLTHTTVAANLLISIEWDADAAYINSVRQALGPLCNYLYDVYDGQFRIDTIAIFDDGAHWNDCDIRIRASNMQHAEAVAGGLNMAAGAHLFFPRKWFGSKTAGRQQSATENPLDFTTPSNYRTLGHEIGHYVLRFYDEYKYRQADGSFAPAGRCGSVGNYGYMDYQYPNVAAKLVASSELSWSQMYTNGDCTNTKQYVVNDSMSCWDWFEDSFEHDTLAFAVPIIKPDERFLAPPGAHFLGPNDQIAAPEYDAGAQVQITGITAPHYTVTKFITTLGPLGLPVGFVNVLHKRVSQGRTVYQGASSDLGQLIALGVENVDTVYVSGAPITVRIDSMPSPRQLVAGFEWYYGAAAATGSGVSRIGNRFDASSAGDSIMINLVAVQGTYPLVVSTSVGQNDVNVDLHLENAFASGPRVEAWPLGTYAGEDTLITAGDHYTGTLDQPLQEEGQLAIWAEDAGSQAYFFNAGYVIANTSNPGVEQAITSSQGDAEVEIGRAAASFDRMMLTSTDYPPRRDGLPAQSVQAGWTHSFSAYPNASFSTGGNLLIHYDATGLNDTIAGTSLEPSLEVHRWDSSLAEWASIGGRVDTALDLIEVGIVETGVYAAFTTGTPTDVGDDDVHGSVLPDQFELAANYPNPFNAQTAIEFALPHNAEVNVTVYNVLGQQVVTLVDGMKPAGKHRVVWDGRSTGGNAVASGTYLIRMRAGDFEQVRKMMLLR